ncbi:unnamed protein product [Rhizophagus irregularis]|nr:unnamed protein product [Rhizophagus irregularis]
MQNKGLREISNEYSIAVTFEIIMIAVDALVILGAAFGLYAVIFSKKYRMLKLSFGFTVAGIIVILNTSGIVSSIVYGCAEGENSCTFSLVISAYARRKKEKEVAAVRYLNKSSDQTNHNFV